MILRDENSGEDIEVFKKRRASCSASSFSAAGNPRDPCFYSCDPRHVLVLRLIFSRKEKANCAPTPGGPSTSE
jgi:hypothetical protein